MPGKHRQGVIPLLNTGMAGKEWPMTPNDLHVRQYLIALYVCRGQGEASGLKQGQDEAKDDSYKRDDLRVILSWADISGGTYLQTWAGILMYTYSQKAPPEAGASERQTNYGKSKGRFICIKSGCSASGETRS
jgi:hypothetical protein